MSPTRSTLQRLRLLVLLVVASAAAGALYSVLRTPSGTSEILQALSGAVIGAVISSCIVPFELFGAGAFFERGGRRLPLVTAMLLRNACLWRRHHGRPADHSLDIPRP